MTCYPLVRDGSKQKFPEPNLMEKAFKAALACLTRVNDNHICFVKLTDLGGSLTANDFRPEG